MKILLVDDEELGRARLERMLMTLGYTHVTRTKSAQEALEQIQKEHFDLAFLDINMPDITGLELASELNYLHENLPIIFQTAYEEHALEAYDIGAVGYLLKPFTIQQLETTIERVKRDQKEVTDKGYIMSKNGEHFYLLKPEEIFYVKADLSEVMLRTKSGFSYSAKKISDIEKLLAQHDFVKVHRSYLVNINLIKEMLTIEQSKLCFTFNGIDDEVQSSKDGAKLFRQRFA